MKKVLLTMAFVLSMLMAFAISASAAEAPMEYPYIVKEGSIYHESAWGFGSGRHGTVGEDNPYTDVPCEVRLNGYAFLGEYGEVIEAHFDEDASYTDIPNMPYGAITTWVHFSGPVYRNGWLDMLCVYPNIEEEKTPEEVAEQIKAIQSSTKTAVVLDVSGSMNDKQEQVVRQLESMEFEEGTIFEIFANIAVKVSEDDFKARDYYVGGSTNLFGALNALRGEDLETIILISDLCDNYNEILLENQSIKGVIIYNPDCSQEYVTSAIEGAFKNSKIQEVRIR